MSIVIDDTMVENLDLTSSDRVQSGIQPVPLLLFARQDQRNRDEQTAMTRIVDHFAEVHTPRCRPRLGNLPHWEIPDYLE